MKKKWTKHESFTPTEKNVAQTPFINSENIIQPILHTRLEHYLRIPNGKSFGQIVQKL